MRCVIIAFFLTYAGFAQSNIEVVQYSAEFVKDNEISLKPFRQYDTKTLYMSKSSNVFAKHKVEFIPSVILFYNGEEVYRIEACLLYTSPSPRD